MSPIHMLTRKRFRMVTSSLFALLIIKHNNTTKHMPRPSIIYYASVCI